jgi:hypothetical protein
MKPKNAKDFWSGVMFIAFGLFFAGFAQAIRPGHRARMGPGYFPTMLGRLLGIGAFIAFRGLRTAAEDGHGHRPVPLQALDSRAGGRGGVRLLLRPAGLIVALLALIFISSLGSGEFKLKEVLPLALGLCLLVLAVFIWGLGLTIPVWPAFMQR